MVAGQRHGELNPARLSDGVARVLRTSFPPTSLPRIGQTRGVFTGTIRITDKPLRVTLAWTDAPGGTFGNAFNNDVDLTLSVGGNIYKGNIFSGAFSATGGILIRATMWRAWPAPPE
jgi:hypothetical protein